MSNIMMLAVAVGLSIAFFHLIYSLVMAWKPEQFINFVATIHHVSEGPTLKTKVTLNHIISGLIVHFAFGFIFVMVTGYIYELLFGMHGMR